MKSRFLVILILALVSITGCERKLKHDYSSKFDQLVEEKWKTESKWVNAIAHLEGGGYYVDLDEEDEQPMDRPNVVPLLKRLEAEFKLEWEAVLETRDPTYAIAVVAKIPNDPKFKETFQAALVREQKTFPGAILQQWGYKWVSLDFLNQEDAAMGDAEEKVTE